jgi:hypothetical protein
VSARENRRLLVFAIVAAIAFAVAWGLYHRAGDSPEERAREQAEKLRERAHDAARGTGGPGSPY